MHRFLLVAMIATLVFCGETQAQRGRFFQRLKEDIFGTQSKTPQKPTSKQQQQSRTPTLANQQKQSEKKGATGQQRIPSPASRYQPTQNRSYGNSRNTAAAKRFASATRKGFGLVLDINRDKELYVTQVDPRGNAAQAGIRRGDVVLEIGGLVATSIEEYEQISKAMNDGDQMEFRIERGGRTDKMLVTWGQAPDPEDNEVASQGNTPKSANSRTNRYEFVPPRSSGNSDSQSVLSNRSRNTLGAAYSSSNQLQQLSRTVQQQQQTIRQLQSEVNRLRRALGNR